MKLQDQWKLERAIYFSRKYVGNFSEDVTFVGSLEGKQNFSQESKSNNSGNLSISAHTESVHAL